MSSIHTLELIQSDHIKQKSNKNTDSQQADIQKLISQLKTLLNNNDLQARKIFTQIEENLVSDNYSALLQSLGKKINQLDYSSALVSTLKLAKMIQIETGEECNEP
ncbi:hypothetical protein MNBD_GAMMA16-1834 [hydrothermal vent metagenome]|uniref:Uncharacterized protein n=1 Tax=hydrothermal vent metagenome TaxID=652676 RepID=A0A3B0ZEG7_9ZZZZ